MVLILTYNRFIMLRVFLFIVAVHIALGSMAQKTYSVKSKRAIKQYKMAEEAYQSRNRDQALGYLLKAIDIEPNFVEAHLCIADIYHTKGKIAAEIKSLKKAIAIDASFFSSTYLNLAEAYRKIGAYQQAKNAVEQFMALDKKSKRAQKRAKTELKRCNYALNLKANPVNIQPQPLKGQINTSADEYWVTPTADEQSLIFTRLILPAKQEDFYISTRTDSTWSKAKPLSEAINTSENEGAQSITADGKMMYFTACNRKDSYGRCDIYYSKRIGDTWTAPINVGKPINSAAWEAQPSISADGRTLYFVSNRRSGKGKMDIYCSHLIEMLPNGKQRWSKPVNMNFNTPKNEMSPFIHASGNYLIFASDGLLGMGKLDLYKVEREKNGVWGKPINMGYPINTHRNEMGLIVNAVGNKAYFASDRDSLMKKDIYTFSMPKHLRPPKVAWIKGKIQDAIQKKPLCARLQLVDLQTNDTIYQLYADKIDGTFLMCLPSQKTYGFVVEKKGYFSYSNHFNTASNHSQQLPQKLLVNLEPIKLNQPMVLNNLFFKVDAWDIEPESENELNRLVLLLKQNNTLKVEIAGHTDSSGSQSHNQILSEKRAKSVCDYLLAKGISQNRLSAKGYGSSRPIATNTTKEGKSKNRRITFLLKH